MYLYPYDGFIAELATIEIDTKPPGLSTAAVHFYSVHLLVHDIAKVRSEKNVSKICIP